MKTYLFPALILLMISFSLNCQNQTEVKTTLGASKILTPSEIKVNIRDTLKSMPIIIEEDNQKIFIGYFTDKDEQTVLKKLDRLSDNKIRYLITNFYVDDAQKYKAIAAVENSSPITINNIKKINVKENGIDIFLDYAGAKSWAEFTDKNKNKSVAITINDEIYSTPYIIQQIKTGALQINGLKDKKNAVQLTELLENGYSK